MVPSLHRWLWKSLRRIESYRNKGMYGYIYSSSKKYSNQFVSHKKILIKIHIHVWYKNWYTCTCQELLLWCCKRSKMHQGNGENHVIGYIYFVIWSGDILCIFLQIKSWRKRNEEHVYFLVLYKSTVMNFCNLEFWMLEIHVFYVFFC